jgi:hypothetical protein
MATHFITILTGRALPNIRQREPEPSIINEMTEAARMHNAARAEYDRSAVSAFPWSGL